jgi:hypothetical protein
MKPGEAVSVALKWTMVGAVLVLLACVLPVACDSNGGGSNCFPPEHGPADPSCAGFDLTLTCPVDLASWYSCTCTATGTTQTWICTPASTGAGGGGGGGAGGGGGGTGGTTASASTTAGSASSAASTTSSGGGAGGHDGGA